MAHGVLMLLNSRMMWGKALEKFSPRKKRVHYNTGCRKCFIFYSEIISDAVVLTHHDAWRLYLM